MDWRPAIIYFLRAAHPRARRQTREKIREFYLDFFRDNPLPALSHFLESQDHFGIGTGAEYACSMRGNKKFSFFSLIQKVLRTPSKFCLLTSYQFGTFRINSQAS